MLRGRKLYFPSSFWPLFLATFVRFFRYLSNLFFYRELFKGPIVHLVPHRTNDNSCEDCIECIQICPTKAIELTKKNKLGLRLGQCISCQMCVEFCPEGILKMQPNSQTLLVNKNYLAPF